MNNSFLGTIVLSFFFACLSFGQNLKPKRVNPMTPIEGVKGLPHVLIIGDSISIGYTLPTRGPAPGKSQFAPESPPMEGPPPKA